jgi:hypothetical protein
MARTDAEVIHPGAAETPPARSVGEIMPPPAAAPPRTPRGGDFTDEERDLVLRSVIASEALEGFELPCDVASRLLDQVQREPLIELD